MGVSLDPVGEVGGAVPADLDRRGVDGQPALGSPASPAA